MLFLTTACASPIPKDFMDFSDHLKSSDQLYPVSISIDNIRGIASSVIVPDDAPSKSYLGVATYRVSASGYGDMVKRLTAMTCPTQGQDLATLRSDFFKVAVNAAGRSKFCFYHAEKDQNKDFCVVLDVIQSDMDRPDDRSLIGIPRSSVGC